MAVIILNANVSVRWASSIVNINLPTPTECNNAIPLETLLRSDGLDITVSNTKSPAGNLGSRYDLERMGTIGYGVKLGFHHDTVADTAWGLFPYKTAGVLIVRRGLARTTTFATGQGSNGGPNGTLALYPLEAGVANEATPPGNWDFDLEFALYGDPAERAVVA